MLAAANQRYQGPGHLTGARRGPGANPSRKKRPDIPPPATSAPSPQEELIAAIAKAGPGVQTVVAPVATLAGRMNLTLLENEKGAKALADFSATVQKVAADLHPFASYENMLSSWLGATPFHRVSVSREIAPLLPGLMYKGVQAVATGQYRVRHLVGVGYNDSKKTLLSPRSSSIRVDEQRVESIPTEVAYLLEDDQGRHLMVELSRQSYYSSMIQLTVHAHKDQEEMVGQFYDRLVTWTQDHNFYQNKVLRYVLTSSGEYMQFMDGLKEKKATWDDIALPPQSEELIKGNTTEFLKTLDLYRRNGQVASRNLLLTGPPGNGKSMVNDILMHDLQGRATFIYVTARSIPMAYAVSRIFDAARMLRPAVVILEDLDLLGSADRYSNGRQDVLNELLNQISGVYDNSGLVVVGSTNQPNVFDEALLRPLRFSTIVPFPLPDLERREVILKKITRTLNLAPDVDLHKLAERTDEFSGAGLTELKEMAIQQAIRTGSVGPDQKVRLEWGHFEYALGVIELKKRYQEESLEEGISA